MQMGSYLSPFQPRQKGGDDRPEQRKDFCHASPGADLPEVPVLNPKGGERDHARHGSNPWARGCRELV